VKYRIYEYQNDNRVIEHRDFTIFNRNIFEVISTRTSSKKRSRSQSCSSGRPFKYPRTENSAVERWRSSIYKSTANSIDRASKRSLCRSQSYSLHRPIKYLIVDEFFEGRGVGRASRKPNTTNSLTIYDDVNSTSLSTCKRSRLPSCTDHCPPVKCLILNVYNENIEDCEDDYEDYTDHEIVLTTLDVDEYEQFFILFNDDEEDCLLNTAPCFCVLVYVNAKLHKDSSELLELSMMQIFLFYTQ
jgi:hypothetical protein